MSAFLVSKTHIRALVSFAVAHHGQIYIPGLDPRDVKGDFRLERADQVSQRAITERYFPVLGYADELGYALWRANARSLKARYPTDWEDMLPDGGMTELQAFKFTLVEFPAVVILKACDCFDYQACEVEGYYESWAAKAIEAIRNAATTALPGWDTAPWGIEDPAGGAADDGPIALSSLFARRRA